MSPNNKHAYLKVQIIEQVINIYEYLLWERKKYWQAQLLTSFYGMNNINDLCSMKRKRYRK